MAEYSGYGTTLSIYVTNAYVAVAQIRDLSGPAMALDTPEVSHRDSAWKKFVAGQIDPGEVTFDIVYDPDANSHKAGALGGLAYALLNRRREQFKITFPDAAAATTAIFYGFVSKFTPKEPMNDALTADLTIKIDGEVTWA